MESGGEPGGQTGLGVAQVDTGDADLGQSLLMRPRPQLLDEPLHVEPMTLLHAPILESRTLHWRNEADCAAFAALLARQPALRDAHVELHGPLGAGKTTFVRHLLRALGVTGRIKSPTYTVLEPHHVGDLAISHFDFYRFDDPREWEDAGLREVFAAPGLKLSEWPQKAAGQLPPADLRLHLAVRGDTAREVRLEACSERGEALLR